LIDIFSNKVVFLSVAQWRSGAVAQLFSLFKRIGFERLKNLLKFLESKPQFHYPSLARCRSKGVWGALDSIFCYRSIQAAFLKFL
jgi:hypothetical protein